MGQKNNWALAVQDIRVTTRRDQITIMTDLLDIIKQMLPVALNNKAIE